MLLRIITNINEIKEIRVKSNLFLQNANHIDIYH